MSDTVRNFVDNLNAWGQSQTPFVFMIDYKFEKPLAWKLSDVDPAVIRFDFNGFTNQQAISAPDPMPEIVFEKHPVAFTEYAPKFDEVMSNLRAGNSFLVNLSVPTPVETNLSLPEIFHFSEAPYRLLFQDEFVCFSPEIFVKTKGRRISSFPMKGTIDASLPGAELQILSDFKEAAEHATIVDLIRNDLSMVADKVWVERYRYLDRVETLDKTLLQVSSEIAGELMPAFENRFGDLMQQLLPAGSITGAPKPSTMQIIAEAEQYERGYYTGVMGYFDGDIFESAVMIRFIENQNGQFVFKSGGGITALSNAASEYQEMIDKVYLPFNHVTHTVH